MDRWRLIVNATLFDTEYKDFHVQNHRPNI